MCIFSVIEAVGRRFIRSFEEWVVISTVIMIMVISVIIIIIILSIISIRSYSLDMPKSLTPSKLKGGWEGPRSPLLIFGVRRWLNTCLLGDPMGGIAQNNSRGEK